VLEFALLGLLKERPMHGYDLRKRLREEFGPLSNLSYGSLYPALARLEADGAIKAVDVSGVVSRREAVPLTGSLAGERAATVARRATQVAALALSSRGTRGRKVYEITPRGQDLFEQLLDADVDPDDPRDFTLRLTFARHLSPVARLRLLERRRTEIQARLERAGRARRQPARTLDRFEEAIAEHAEDVVASELSWVEALLEREEALSKTEAPELATSRSTAARRSNAASSRTDRERQQRVAPARAGAGIHEGRSH
jgi:DNA-binding PadR family transcriptional regulator